MIESIPFADDATPVIIAGAPRSGTTFLTTALNSHPQLLITNELRCWSLFNDLRRRTEKPTELLPGHPVREPFRDAMMAAHTALFRDFYRTEVTRETLGCPSQAGNSVTNIIKAYGDKNPGYADAHSPGCLAYIAESMPDAKFVHIHRDPRSCIASYKAIPVYSNEVERLVNTWQRHVSTVADLKDAIGPERVLEFAYEDLVSKKANAIFRRIEDHIGVDHASEPLAFLARERKEPVPYRSPVTPKEELGQTTYHDRLSTEEIIAIEDGLADLMQRYGYARTTA